MNFYIPMLSTWDIMSIQQILNKLIDKQIHELA